MDPTRLMTRTATISHVEPDPDNPDAYGNPGLVTSVTTAACEIQQVSRSEDTVNTAQQSEDWSLFVHPDALVEGSDRIVVDGVAYELVGPPWPARNPRTGVVSHIEAQVRRVV